MHTLIICRDGGYSVHHGDFGECQKRFAAACDDRTTVVSSWWNEAGNLINAYACVDRFRACITTKFV